MKNSTSYIINLTRAYLGLAFFTWWGIYSYGNTGIPFNDLMGFIINLGGLI
jgi:hypothetical protein